MATLTSLVDIQDRYTERVLAGRRKAERMGTAHVAAAVQAKARIQMLRNLRELGYDDAAISQAFSDANDMTHLRWLAGE